MMAVIKPFRAVRPPADMAQLVSSPPYDVVNYDEARELSRNPHSFIHVVRSEVDLSEGTDPYSDVVYERARKNLLKMLKDGLLTEDEGESFYVYRQQMGEHVQIGLVACCSVDEYEQDKIKKHEFTRKPKEEDRVKHTLAVKANTGMVFLACRDDGRADSALREATDNHEPLLDTIDENNVRHTIFKVAELDTMKHIRNVFDAFPQLYIADGHHRAASAARAREILRQRNPHHTGNEEYNFFLASIFPHNHLKIMDYNRVVSDLSGLSVSSFLKRVEESFLVEKAPSSPYRPDSKHQFGMYIGGQWYLLEARPGTFQASDPVESLDASILQNNLLGPVLGINDPRTDSRIDFVGGIRGLQNLEEKVGEGWAVAFSLFPTSMDDLIAVADSGRVMPPKSTWFEPKLRSGLLVHLIT